MNATEVQPAKFGAGIFGVGKWGGAEVEAFGWGSVLAGTLALVLGTIAVVIGRRMRRRK